MAPRGLSMEEKKTKNVLAAARRTAYLLDGSASADKRPTVTSTSIVLEIFHETAEFYSLKELEKIAPKTKGIVMQSVKEVLDDLVGDSLVICEKIGTGNYFWSFPSTAGAMKQAAVSKAQKELDSVTSKIDETNDAVAEAEKGREDTAERRQLLSVLEKSRATSAALQAELAAFGAADPVRYERKSKAVQVCKDSAVRWTDNAMVLMQYAGSLGADQSELRTMLNLNDDWEDLKT